MDWGLDTAAGPTNHGQVAIVLVGFNRIDDALRLGLLDRPFGAAGEGIRPPHQHGMLRIGLGEQRDWHCGGGRRYPSAIPIHIPKRLECAHGSDALRV